PSERRRRPPATRSRSAPGSRRRTRPAGFRIGSRWTDYAGEFRDCPRTPRCPRKLTSRHRERRRYACWRLLLQPPRPDRGDGVTRDDRRLRGVSEDRKQLGAPAHVHDVREDRLLRLVAEQACNRTWTRERPSDHSFRRAWRGLELVLPGRTGV